MKNNRERDNQQQIPKKERPDDLHSPREPFKSTTQKPLKGEWEKKQGGK